MARKIKRFFVFLLFSMCFSLLSKRVCINTENKSVNKDTSSGSNKTKFTSPISIVDNAANAQCGCYCGEDGNWHCD